ncbi:MAG: dynamin family protein [Candidatus Gastranaerophilaceae bacterium]
MAFVNQETKAKLNKISTNMKNYATLLDEPIKKGEVGMGMPLEANIFRENANDVENGVFKVLVMGKFKNGKSTFINALVGKVMMAARATACTAVIATVEYGNVTDDVKVIYSDSTKTKTMSLEQFTEEFALSEEDQQYIEDGGRLDRFANVSHVEMQSTEEIFFDGLRLIDSPGLEEATSRTKATNEFVPKANAIIFTLSATSLFSSAEKEFIAANFAKKNMRNVFFVVNRIDNLTEDQLEKSVKPSVRIGLEDVFTDKDGHFNEELYNKRVFFTNAYGALCVRTGEKYKICLGKKEIPVDIEIEDTGILEFENSLREFLNSDERINSTFYSTLHNMANTYQIAAKSVVDDKAVRSQSKEQREKNAILAKKSLDDAISEVERIRKTVNDSAGQIAKKVYLDLCAYVQNDIPREFEAVAKDEAAQTKFGMGKMISLASNMLLKKDDEIKKIYQPFMDSIEDYIKTKLADWSDRVPTLIDSDLKDLEDELNAQFSDFDMKLEEAANLFAYGNTKSPTTSKMGFKTGLQNAMALYNLDISLAVENTASGGMGWMDFAKRAAIQIGIDSAISFIFGAPFLFVSLPVEVVSMIIKSKKMAKDIIISVGNAAFESLAQKVSDSEVIFTENIISSYIEKGEQIASTAINLVNEQQAKMDKLLIENKMSDSEAKAEDERADSTLSQMHNCIDKIYNELYGHIPTETEFLNLAKNEIKK